MTEQDSITVADLIDRVPKIKPYLSTNPHVDEDGRGMVDIYTTASIKTVKSWFKQAGAVVTDYWRNKDSDSVTVLFDWK
jgi:hypothetical protein